MQIHLLERICMHLYLLCIYYRYEYLWADGVQYKRPTPLPARQYISLLMDWVENQINNEEIFPVSVGKCYTIYYA